MKQPETDVILRIRHVIGDPRANPPQPGLLPISKAGWYRGIKAGRFPRGVAIGPRSVGWRLSDLNRCFENLPTSSRRTQRLEGAENE